MHCINGLLLTFLLTRPSGAGWNHSCFHCFAARCCDVPMAPSYWKPCKRSQLHSQGVREDVMGSFWPILWEKCLFNLLFPDLPLPFFLLHWQAFLFHYAERGSKSFWNCSLGLVQLSGFLITQTPLAVIPHTINVCTASGSKRPTCSRMIWQHGTGEMKENDSRQTIPFRILFFRLLKTSRGLSQTVQLNTPSHSSFPDSSPFFYFACCPSLFCHPIRIFFSFKDDIHWLTLSAEIWLAQWKGGGKGRREDSTRTHPSANLPFGTLPSSLAM